MKVQMSLEGISLHVSEGGKTLVNVERRWIRCISLWQPWATLWVLGEKLNETRSWDTKSGWTGVHAAKRTDYARAAWEETNLFPLALARHGVASWRDLPFGALVGFVRITGCQRTSDIRPDWGTQEREFGDYSDFRFAWKVDKRILLPEAIPMKGQQGFWRIEVPKGVDLG